VFNYFNFLANTYIQNIRHAKVRDIIERVLKEPRLKAQSWIWLHSPPSDNVGKLPHREEKDKEREMCWGSGRREGLEPILPKGS
jgi:hypothetical protein